MYIVVGCQSNLYAMLCMWCNKILFICTSQMETIYAGVVENGDETPIGGML